MALALPPPPRSEAELMQRVLQISGQPLEAIAAQYDQQVPQDPVRSKGWAGQLIELALGASAASLPEPDFQLIGVELKTIPVTAQGKPLESTYVCNVPLEFETAPQWESSTVWHKLARVLWVPIIVAPNSTIAERQIGRGMLWSPSPEQASCLRQDWEELMDRVCLGDLESITSHMGVFLQIRPKAANAQSRRWGVGEQGERVRTLPRGFYLRSSFTASLLSEYYAH